MKSLYVRIYLTLVVLLLAFAFGATWLFQRQMEQERGTADAAATERLVSMGMLIHHALPAASAPREEQAAAVAYWGQRLRMAIALQDDKGQRIGASELFERREDGPVSRQVHVNLDDGRSLVLIRAFRPPQGFAPGGASSGPGFAQSPGQGASRALRRENSGFNNNANNMTPQMWGWLWPGAVPNGEGLAIVLVLLFLGVALGAYPVVRRLTRRLEALKTGVEAFGAGDLSRRVDDSGRDEVAALARTFNNTATRTEALLRSNKNLLANASHELRSPLARLKMAFAMLDDAPPAGRARLVTEIHTNIAELDALVEEVLLASRLEAGSQTAPPEKVDLLGLAAEEAARSGVEFDPAEGLSKLRVMGDERLLRRALRNLLENARRYGGDQANLELAHEGGRAIIRVLDRGPGVPEPMRERIFEAFFRLPGHAEQAGGVGLGLSLVKQIATAHEGIVRCEAREGGGSVFVVCLPALK